MAYRGVGRLSRFGPSAGQRLKLSDSAILRSLTRPHRKPQLRVGLPHPERPKRPKFKIYEDIHARVCVIYRGLQSLQSLFLAREVSELVFCRRRSVSDRRGYGR